MARSTVFVMRLAAAAVLALALAPGVAASGPPVRGLAPATAGALGYSLEDIAGAYLVVVPGFWECSSLEGEPFHATTEAELIACVESGFEFIDTVEITLDG